MSGKLFLILYGCFCPDDWVWNMSTSISLIWQYFVPAVLRVGGHTGDKKEENRATDASLFLKWKLKRLYKLSSAPVRRSALSWQQKLTGKSKCYLDPAFWSLRCNCLMLVFITRKTTRYHSVGSSEQGLKESLVMFGLDNLISGYFMQHITSVVMLVRIEFEVRNGPSLSTLCNIKRGPTEGSLACTVQGSTPCLFKGKWSPGMTSKHYRKYYPSALLAPSLFAVCEDAHWYSIRGTIDKGKQMRKRKTKKITFTLAFLHQGRVSNRECKCVLQPEPKQSLWSDTWNGLSRKMNLVSIPHASRNRLYEI